MAVTFIEYKGKTIVYADYRGLKKEQQMLEVLDELGMVGRKAKDKILLLQDYRDTYLTKDFMVKVKTLGKELALTKINKHAMLGITGMKKILLRAYVGFSGDTVRIFDLEEQAKEYLVS